MGIDPRPDPTVALLRDGETPSDQQGEGRERGRDEREQHADGEDDLRRLLDVGLVVHGAEDRQGNCGPGDRHQLRQQSPQRPVLGLPTPPGVKLVVVDDVGLDRRREEQLPPEGQAGKGEQRDTRRDVPFADEKGAAQRQDHYGEGAEPGGALPVTLRCRQPEGNRGQPGDEVARDRHGRPEHVVAGANHIGDEEGKQGRRDCGGDAPDDVAGEQDPEGAIAQSAANAGNEGVGRPGRELRALPQAQEGERAERGQSDRVARRQQ